MGIECNRCYLERQRLGDLEPYCRKAEVVVGRE